MVGRIKGRLRTVLRTSAAAAGLSIGPLPYVASYRHGADALPSATLLCIYRRRNAQRVEQLAEQAQEAKMDVRLWALDEADPQLAEFTVGSGAGSRFELLNRLVVENESWLMIADDDVRFVGPRPFRTLLAICSEQRFDIAQPAQARGSYRSHQITRQQLFASARETTFVEIGPVVAFSPRARVHVLPFPESGMGWGAELEWSALRESHGLGLGVVDCVPVQHLNPPGGGYDAELEFRLLEERLARHGFTSLEEIQKTIRVRRLA